MPSSEDGFDSRTFPSNRPVLHNPTMAVYACIVMRKCALFTYYMESMDVDVVKPSLCVTPSQ